MVARDLRGLSPNWVPLLTALLVLCLGAFGTTRTINNPHAAPCVLAFSIATGLIAWRARGPRKRWVFTVGFGAIGAISVFLHQTVLCGMRNWECLIGSGAIGILDLLLGAGISAVMFGRDDRARSLD